MGKSYPKIQVLTIEGLLSGKERPEYPFSLTGGTTTFKKAKVEVKSTKQTGLFGGIVPSVVDDGELDVEQDADDDD